MLVISGLRLKKKKTQQKQVYSHNHKLTVGYSNRILSGEENQDKCLDRPGLDYESVCIGVLSFSLSRRQLHSRNV